MKFGVVGHGFMGPRHVRLMDETPGLSCIAVCDIDDYKLRNVKSNIHTYTNFNKMLENPEIEGVVIATPNRFHAPQAIAAMKAGKHVLCEKPAALNLGEFTQMVDTAKENHVTLTVHQQRRFDQDFQSVKYAYDNGLLGTIYLMQSQLYGYHGHNHSWHQHKYEGGGMIYNWGVHLIDQILFLANSPLKTVFADVRGVFDEEVDDYFKIIMRYENGLTAEIMLGSYLLSDKDKWFPRHWYVGGSTGSMYIDGFIPEGKIIRTTHLLENVSDEAGRYCGPTRSFGIPDIGLLIEEDIPHIDTDAKEFYINYSKALRGEEPFLVTLSQEKSLFKVLDAIRKSAETMESVDVDIENYL